MTTRQACVADRLTDDEARLMLIGEIDRAYDDPSQPDAQPFVESLEPLLAAYDECLRHPMNSAKSSSR